MHARNRGPLRQVEGCQIILISPKTVPQITELANLPVLPLSGKSCKSPYAAGFKYPKGPFPTNLPHVQRKRENCILQVRKCLSNPGTTYCPKHSRQVVELQNCSNCVLVLAGNSEFNPCSENPIPSLPSKPAWHGRVVNRRGFRTNSESL